MVGWFATDVFESAGNLFDVIDVLLSTRGKHICFRHSLEPPRLLKQSLIDYSRRDAAHLALQPPTTLEAPEDENNTLLEPL